ncbi:MAG: 4-alpha-glucanotransferase [Muribaculaceae bacterium]|nr:4-alpha-glucanotransferase [Muribaculaceae bacterium]
MKVKFQIDYQTVYGEEMVLNILNEDRTIAKQLPMKTSSGSDWKCELVVENNCFHLCYYYSVRRGNNTVRHEWLVMPHFLDLTSPKGQKCTCYDHWIDNPDDSYLYTSAFTQCVSARESSMPAEVKFSQTLQLKVRAPQLRAGERLVIVGNSPVLGDWDAAKCVAMSEHAPNEWQATLDAAKFKNSFVEFKFVIMAEGQAPVWENGNNRTIVLPSLRAGDVVVYELTKAYFPLSPIRVAGTVIPIFSLRSEGSYGVGDFGDLKTMIDWVAMTGQRALQVLPINDTTITGTWRDSYPYNSISIYALHPQYIDLRQLPKLKDAKRAKYYEDLRLALNALDQIDYERVNEAKRGYVKELFEQNGASVMRSKEFKAFMEENAEWLVPYAAFSHYRDQYGTATFGKWPEHRSFTPEDRAAMTDHRTKLYKEVSIWYYMQFLLDKQMRGAHEYARSKNVILKGDIPIGISRDGVEAWVEPKYFNLNGQAGAPPDAFSVNGQNWGFPTYNWDAMLDDGCAWWIKRFSKMAQYFDAYRIDHVLGFFRIWEIPIDAVHGLLGHFAPALGMSPDEIRGYGFNFQEEHMTTPFITDWIIDRMLGERAQEFKDKYLKHEHDDVWSITEHYDTQRKVEAAFAGSDSQDDITVRDTLYALIGNVLFVRDHKTPGMFHPRISAQHSFIYEALYDNDKQAFNRLYNDYFYRRNNNYWYGEAMKKLPTLAECTRMLVCAEDLGMVPDCVAWVMNELRILSLEIESMPKDPNLKFGNLHANPYRSVATISTHDMPTLRQWWDEDWNITQQYYNNVLWRGDAAPHPLPSDIASQVVGNHLASPSMLCLLSLQDWMATDDKVRRADADAERINIPANPRHYWRYRMHMTIEQLINESDFNGKVYKMIINHGR